jgi:hypothetical protein
VHPTGDSGRVEPSRPDLARARHLEAAGSRVRSRVGRPRLDGAPVDLADLPLERPRVHTTRIGNPLGFVLARRGPGNEPDLCPAEATLDQRGAQLRQPKEEAIDPGQILARRLNRIGAHSRAAPRHFSGPARLRSSPASHERGHATEPARRADGRAPEPLRPPPRPPASRRGTPGPGANSGRRTGGCPGGNPTGSPHDKPVSYRRRSDHPRRGTAVRGERLPRRKIDESETKVNSAPNPQDRGRGIEQEARG